MQQGTELAEALRQRDLARAEVLELREDVARYDEWLRDRINMHEDALDEIRALRRLALDADLDLSEVSR